VDRAPDRATTASGTPAARGTWLDAGGRRRAMPFLGLGQAAAASLVLRISLERAGAARVAASCGLPCTEAVDVDLGISDVPVVARFPLSAIERRQAQAPSHDWRAIWNGATRMPPIERPALSGEIEMTAVPPRPPRRARTIKRSWREVPWWRRGSDAAGHRTQGPWVRVSRVFKSDPSTYVAALLHDELDPVEAVAKGRSWRSDPESKGECNREAIMSRLFGRQPSIVRLIDSRTVLDTNWMLFERAWGDMWDWLRDKRFSYLALDRDDRRLLVDDMLDGVARLHERRVLHGDIKMDNIFMYRIGHRWRAKIGDLGLACVLGVEADEPEFRELTCGHIVYASAMRPPEVAAAFKAYGLTGSTLDPRIFRAQVGLEADLWALGITLYYMMLQSYPWPRAGNPAWPTTVVKDDGALKFQFVDIFVSELWSTAQIDEWERQLLRCLLTLDASRRCNASSALDLINDFFHLSGQV